MIDVSADTPPDDVASLIRDWSSQPDISARSVLVTIFGDTVLPVTRSLWLSQLFTLTDVFGFSARLVRTSMYRLAAEGWFSNERVGRQSCYHLTEIAVSESEQADKRIYHALSSDWSGTWSLVLLENSGLDLEEQVTIGEHLAWHGFIALGRGVVGSPTASSDDVKGICALLRPTAHVPVASAHFEDLEALVDGGFFANGLNTPEIESAYTSFVQRYEAMQGVASGAQPLDAFAIRSMLVHDLRRIRLRYPDIPAQLLPADWVGDRAERIAAQLYAELSVAAAPALSEVLDVDYPATFPGRFA